MIAGQQHLLAAVSSTFMIWTEWAPGTVPGAHVSVALGDGASRGQVPGLQAPGLPAALGVIAKPDA